MLTWPKKLVEVVVDRRLLKPRNVRVAFYLDLLSSALRWLSAFCKYYGRLYDESRVLGGSLL